MSDNPYTPKNPARPTQEQQAAIARLLFDLLQDLANVAPSLEENVERLRDYKKTTIGGVYLAITALFGEDEDRMIREVVESAYQARCGPLPNRVPRVVATGADTGIFKRHIYGDLGWPGPDDADKR